MSARDYFAGCNPSPSGGRGAPRGAGRGDRSMAEVVEAICTDHEPACSCWVCRDERACRDAVHFVDCDECHSEFAACWPNEQFCSDACYQAWRDR